MISTGNIFGVFAALCVFFAYFFLELESLQIDRSSLEFGMAWSQFLFWDFKISGQKIVLEKVDLDLTKLSPEFLASKEFLEEDEVDDGEEYYDEDPDQSLKTDLPDATDVLSGSPEPDFEIPYEDVNEDGTCKPKRHFVFHKKEKGIIFRILRSFGLNSILYDPHEA